MGADEHVRLNVGMDVPAKVIWWLGWNPVPIYILLVSLAALGWMLLRHPAGLILGLAGLLPRWKAISLINRNAEDYLGQAKLLVKEKGADRLGVRLDAAMCSVSSAGLGRPPFGSPWNPTYEISVAYICDTFFGVYQGAAFSLETLTVQLPLQGEEIYFRHVSAVKYSPPHIEVTLSDGKTMKQFSVGSDRGTTVVAALRAKLRSAVPAPISSTIGSDSRGEAPQEVGDDETGAPAHLGTAVSLPRNLGEERYCYLRIGKLQQLLSDPSVLDVLIVQLEVPGEPAVHRQLTHQQKFQYIEAQIDHFRRTPTSVWYGVPAFEVIAASLWRAQDDDRQRGLPRKLVRRGWFCGVSDEADLLMPVAKWLKSLAYEPYMEIPMGLGRVDVVGYMKPSLSGSGRLAAVELKNNYDQFKRALNQAGTFAEYSNLVYIACTPAFAAEYLDRNERAVKHWDPAVLERKIVGGGFGLLIVERDQVFEVIKPAERAPQSSNFSSVVSALSPANLVGC